MKKVYFFLFLVLLVSLFTFSKVLGLSTINNDVVITFTGDVMLGRSVMITSLKLNDPTYPFLKVADTLRASDLVFVNLENPIVANCPQTSGGMIFCADPVMLKGLKYANISLAGISNNHILNYGTDGLKSTKKYLSDNGITPVSNELVVKEVKGIKFGFYTLDAVTNGYDLDKTGDTQRLQDADKKVDFLLVMVHWGNEYQPTSNTYQKNLARKLVALGADVIIGSHPHWVQDVEYINGKPIYYSLGNFVFDQMWSTKTREGLAIKLTFEKGKIVKDEKLPILMTNWAQPEFIN